MRWLSGIRILAIARKEFFHLRRDHLTGGMVVGLPIMMTLLFGYAINNDVRNLNAGVVDEANTTASRALVADAVATQVIKQRLFPWLMPTLVLLLMALVLPLHKKLRQVP